MTTTFKSNWISALIAGDLLTIICPWIITIDTSNRKIVLQKRNWYLIGIDENSYSYEKIRTVKIDSLIIGSNISIGIRFGANINCYFLSSADALAIRSMLLP